jgi:hypothetical protein
VPHTPETVFADEALLTSARLVTPIVLDTFLRLRRRGPLDAADPPRTAAELADMTAAVADAHDDQPPADALAVEQLPLGGD